jgi:hypothetical protein
VAHDFMGCKAAANDRVELAFIGLQPRLAVDVLVDAGVDSRRFSNGRMERANAPPRSTRTTTARLPLA